MKILLLGKNGQVGWELQRALAPLGSLIALDRKGEKGLCGDLADVSGLLATVRETAPDVIVNAGAYTAVDRAESEPELARAINAVAPGVLAQEAARLGALLVHYSTDYVFSGEGERPWRETDATNPLSVYGKTKLEGERAVQASGCRHLLFRTSWLYGSRGGNFAKTMLRLAQERDSLDVIDDQVGAPTGADLVADITAHALRAQRAGDGVLGLYHLAASGETTWHGYARYVLEFARGAGVALRVAPESVRPIPSAAYRSAAVRPLNSRLDQTKLQAAFDLTLPDWKVGVKRMLSELTGI